MLDEATKDIKGKAKKKKEEMEAHQKA